MQCLLNGISFNFLASFYVLSQSIKADAESFEIFKNRRKIARSQRIVSSFAGPYLETNVGNQRFWKHQPISSVYATITSSKEIFGSTKAINPKWKLFALPECISLFELEICMNNKLKMIKKIIFCLASLAC